MKRIILLFVLVFSVLMLTACHTDNDPWPVETLPAYVTPVPDATIAPPANTPVPDATPTPGLNG